MFRRVSHTQRLYILNDCLINVKYFFVKNKKKFSSKLKKLRQNSAKHSLPCLLQ